MTILDIAWLSLLGITLLITAFTIEVRHDREIKEDLANAKVILDKDLIRYIEEL